MLAGRWVFHGYFPLSNLYESLLFLSWTLLFIHLLLETKTGSKLLGPIIIPLVLLIDGFSSLTLPIEMQKASPLVPALQSNWLMMHVSLMMLSYATLITGSLLSILFLMLSIKQPQHLQEDSNIKLENPSFAVREGILSLKSNSPTTSKFASKLLENMDNMSYRIISLGFPFLTIGIIAGAVWANEAWGSYWSWDPKETWALITWLVFAAYLHARIIKGWEGKKPALLASLGFFVVWICYLGVNFLGQGLHSYGWMS
jgi:cytochrome c-type biogenesis protein CcsB